MHYREATYEDRGAIAALHAESWRTAYRGAYRDEFLDGDVLQDRTRVWEERLSAPRADQFVILAEQDGRALGFACAYGHEDEQWGTLLDNIHVRRECYRQGIGRHLFAEVARWCRANHAGCGLYLWVLTQNIQAQRFYESLGASDRGGDVFVPPGGGEIHSRRYAWTAVPTIAEADRRTNAG